MNIILVLAPVSLLLALAGLAAFFWTFRSGQYDDPSGDAARVLYDHLDEGPPGASWDEIKSPAPPDFAEQAGEGRRP